MARAFAPEASRRSEPVAPASGTARPPRPSAGTVRAPGLARPTDRWGGALLLVACAACVDSTGPPYPMIETAEFAPSLGVDLSEMTRIGGGAYVRDDLLGSGAELRTGRDVTVSWSLHVTDGTRVESRVDVPIRMGCLKVVRGLEVGINGMRVGGRRMIIVPGRLGFGPQRPPEEDVPYGSILVYTVEAHGSTHSPQCACQCLHTLRPRRTPP